MIWCKRPWLQPSNSCYHYHITSSRHLTLRSTPDHAATILRRSTVLSNPLVPSGHPSAVWPVNLCVRHHLRSKSMHWKGCAAWFLTIAIASSGYSAPPLSTNDQQAIQSSLERVRTAILNEDTSLLVAQISRSGLTCTDTNFSHNQVAAFLKDKNSFLYISLFDTGRFAKRCGQGYPTENPAISEKEFLSKATDVKIEILSIGQNWAEVIYRSATKGHYQREWIFRREAGGWKLSEGLIIGGCFCG